MSYEGPIPHPVPSGFSGASTLTGIITGSGTSLFTANAVSQYNTLVAGASNAVAGISPGTAGNLLQSNGGSANPSYAAIPLSAGRNMVFLQSQTANNSSSLDFTSQISSLYTTYYFNIYNWVAANNNARLVFRVSTNNGSSYLGSSYLAGRLVNLYNSNSLGVSNDTTFQIVCREKDTSQPGGAANFWLFNGGTASVKAQWVGRSITPTGGTQYMGRFVGTQTTGNAVNAIRFLATLGNLKTATVVMYGIRDT